jgi:hypothetical protein
MPRPVAPASLRKLRAETKAVKAEMNSLQLRPAVFRQAARNALANLLWDASVLALDHVLARLDAAAAHPFAHTPQEIRHPSGEISDDVAAEGQALAGPGIGMVALYWEISPHTGTRTKS